VQVDPVKPALKAPGTKRLTLIYDGPLSTSAFKFNLRRHIEAFGREMLRPLPLNAKLIVKVRRCRLTL